MQVIKLFLPYPKTVWAECNYLPTSQQETAGDFIIVSNCNKMLQAAWHDHFEKYYI